MIDSRFYVRTGALPMESFLQQCGLPVDSLGSAAGTYAEISGVASPERASSGDLIFMENAKFLDAARSSAASFILCKPDLSAELPPEKTIVSPSPQLHFISAIHSLYPPVLQPALADARPISPSAKIAENVIVHHGAVIGAGATIGAGSVIGANAVIGPGVWIGADNDIGANVTLSHTITADRVRILTGARIGQDGFGFLTHQGRHIRMPQMGRVLIGSDTEIGANAAIDRGALVDTVIGSNVIVDNLVQIGHNVQIGDGCILVSQSGVAGSTRLGNYVVLAAQSGIADHLYLGDGAQIGAQAGIMRDVPAGTRMMGSPAQPAREYFRQVSMLAKMGKPAKSTQ